MGATGTGAIRLSVAITTVPERAAMLDALAAQLDPQPVEVFVDHDGRGPWWNTRRAWLATPSDCTHRLILQDDVQVCVDFVATVHKVLALRPESFVSFMCALPQMRDYLAAGKHFMPYLGAYGQAACLPAAWAYAFVGWADAIDFDALPDAFFIQSRLPERQPHDDVLLMQWLYEEGRAACATVPALVRHIGWGQSTLGHQQRYQDGHVPVLAKRVVQGQVVEQPGWYWIGEGRSGLAIDWEEGG